VYTQDEKSYRAQLEVNNPLRVGHWRIYQYSYDADAGKASAYSSFELVYDPWMTWVYVGIFMFLAGSIFLLWEGNKKAGRKNA
jgi:cytochrome c biogenesis protein ResB